MFSAIKLIFNDYVCSASRLPSEDVCSKRSDSNFREFNLKFQTNSITQALNVVCPFCELPSCVMDYSLVFQKPRSNTACSMEGIRNLNVNGAAVSRRGPLAVRRRSHTAKRAVFRLPHIIFGRQNFGVVIRNRQ